jgi:hypothetical protein
LILSGHQAPPEEEEDQQEEDDNHDPRHAKPTMKRKDVEGRKIHNLDSSLAQGEHRVTPTVLGDNRPLEEDDREASSVGEGKVQNILNKLKTLKNKFVQSVQQG